MIRISSISLLFCALFPFLGLSQIGTGKWRMHVPASKAIDVAAGNGIVVAALTSGVVYYSVSDNEYKIYNNLTGLSDIKVSCVTFDDPTSSFLIGYENGNIDQILSSGAVVNIPGVLLANVLGSKRINSLESSNGYVYASTGFGVVVIDPQKKEIKDTYYPGSSSSPILDVTVKEDTLFALTSSGCFKGYLNNNFLADPSQWANETRMPTPVGGSYAKLALQQNEVHVLYKKDGYGGDSIMRMTNSGLVQQIGDNFAGMEINDFSVLDDYFQVCFEGVIVLYDENDGVYKFVSTYNTYTGKPKFLTSLGGNFWVADNDYGLVRYVDQYNFSFISREGPPKDQFFGVNSYKDKVIVASGILDRVTFAYNTSGVYTFQDESWTLYDHNNQPIWAAGNTWDASVVAINPLNEEEMAVGSYSIDALSIINGSTVSNMYNAGNSIIENSALGNGNACITSVEYDEFGNLWMCNGYSNNPLKARLADGSWIEYPTGTEPKNKFTGKLVVDYNNNKWFGSYGVGLVGYNDNETPDVLTDDTYKILHTGTGNGNLPSDVVTALAVDFDNEIWIGTEAGFVVLYNSDGIFNSSSYDASRILVTYEGNVEELLGDTPITDIEIDGGNRKWIATASTGIFLLSADGQEVVAQYNTDNSPLISNNIIDMDFNHTTGELFIVTDLGLVSLRTDATYEDEKYETTTVFPNPVKPEYTGTITIQGIRYNSDVKVTDIAGNLVYQTTSNGGTATWNGKTLSGENVASGVYLFWTATNEGKDEKVGKVAIIR